MYGIIASKSSDLKNSYIVWNPGSNLPPTRFYSSRPDAIKVAHLMAAKNPGEQFAVCKIVGVAKTVTAKYEDFES